MKLCKCKKGRLRSSV